MAQTEILLFLQLISWIYDTLQRDDTRSTARSYFFERLGGEFGDLAEEQWIPPSAGAATPSCSPMTTTQASCILKSN